MNKLYKVLLTNFLCALTIVFGCVISVESAVPVPPRASSEIRQLEILAFDTPRDASKVWVEQVIRGADSLPVAKESTAPVIPMKVNGIPVLKLPCNFKNTVMPRAVWDCQVELDMTKATAVVFDVYSENISAVSFIHFYFRSGKGWFYSEWYPGKEADWCRVRIPRSSFNTEGVTDGWSKIEAFRMSPWVAKREDATLYVANFGIEYSDGSVMILTHAYDDIREQKQSDVYTQTLHQLFETAGLPVPAISSKELSSKKLADVSLLILPYAANMDSNTESIILSYVKNGGKLLASFSLPPAVAEILGVKQSGYIQQSYPGEFSSFRLTTAPAPNMPNEAKQSSWGIMKGTPVKNRGRIDAWWYELNGKKTAYPAIISSENGAWFSHVYLKDFMTDKAKLVLDVASGYIPNIYKKTHSNHLGKLGGSISDISWYDAVEKLRRLPAFSSGNKADTALKSAIAYEKQARINNEKGDLKASHEAAMLAEQRLLLAYSLAQQSVPNEFRATWCHPPEGIKGWDWDKTAMHLKKAGINNLFLNVQHGATVSYPSKYAPLDRSNPDGHDYLTEAITACAKQNIRVHVWLTTFALHGHATPEYEAQLRKNGRLQVRYDGSYEPSLCPSLEINFNLQKNLALEAATWKGVSGVHLDYIRYPSATTCFCKECRRKFEKTLGKPVEQWPEAVAKLGKYRQEWAQFKRDNISQLVQEVYQSIKKTAPDCEVSAAVFYNLQICREDVGQDWALWVHNGWLDFICPMNYTENAVHFKSMLNNQLTEIKGKVPCYPGIGLHKNLGVVGAIRQIEVTREAQTGGMVIYAVYPEYIDSIYTQLGLGIFKN